MLALLAQSAKDIDKQFADDPKTLALLLKRLAETNDALNRDTVALAQWTQLQALLEKTEPPDSDALLDARRQRAATSHRLRRFKESFAILDDLRTKIVTRFGKESEAHGKLLIQMVGPLTELGRIDDAKRALADGSTILTRLYPNDLAKRVALNDDTAAMLTKLGLWRQAMAKLEMVESDLPAYAKLSGVPAREVLIQQNNIEGVRVRLGLYAGTEARLKQILADADKLLGPDNAISADTLDFLAVLACETGRFADCLAHRRALVSLRKKQVGVEPGQVLAAEIDLLSVELALGRAVNPSAVEQLERIFAQIALRYTEPSLGRSYAYRTISDAATNADQLTLADAAQKRVRDDNIALNKMSAERVARLDVSIAATAFARGEAREAATLLTERFRVFSLTDEGDTPRRASLWLQKALYEVEFDLPAAAQSAAKGRAMFERVGTLAPQFKAVLACIDARVSGNAAAIRAAKTAIDQSYTRPKSLPWRAPFLSIM